MLTKYLCIYIYIYKDILLYAKENCLVSVTF